MGVLEALHFDNLALRALPVDETTGRKIRQVRKACYSRVQPTPVEHPCLVAASPSALALLDLDMEETERQEFVKVMSGNRLLPGMDPVAHCYCGYQFGNFAGQLGDGAAIYLGEVVNIAGARWEVQLKGAGLTPFSRQADGRKVLRSSIREFLASEAMHHLGIATTRAGCIITSNTEVIRDILYDGNPISERASIVLRIAPTFFRFGSFEIFKKPDTTTGRAGPSFDEQGEIEAQMLPVMLDHIIKTYFPEIWQEIPPDHQSLEQRRQAEERRREMYLEFYVEVVRRTFQLAAAWQCVGFCHGVLNTDNMSILGLTIDYGPYGFLDRYDPDHVCNHSDDSGRYSFSAQPGVCAWNCEKLAEALGSALDAGRARAQLDALFEQEFNRPYRRVMRRKLGLLELVDEQRDEDLVKDLLEVMHKTGADFTHTFRWLALVEMPPATTHSAGAQNNGEAASAKSAKDTSCNDASTSGSGEEAFLERVLGSLAGPEELARAARPRMHPQNLRVLQHFSHNDLLLASMGVTKEMLQAEFARLARSEELARAAPPAKAAADREAWRGWLRRYRARLQQEADAGASTHARIDAMNGINPRYVLRNWIAQQAIEAAEKGDFSEVRRVLRLLQNPYSDDAAADLSADVTGSSEAACRRELLYDGPVPQWAKDLCVSCSS